MINTDFKSCRVIKSTWLLSNIKQGDYIRRVRNRYQVDMVVIKPELQQQQAIQLASYQVDMVVIKRYVSLKRFTTDSGYQVDMVVIKRY